MSSDRSVIAQAIRNSRVNDLVRTFIGHPTSAANPPNSRDRSHPGRPWLGSLLGRWQSTSLAVRGVARAEASLEVSTDSSTLLSGFSTVGQWGRASFLYRWLTKEPDPEVIVIDLHETWTVGPIIALMDRVLDPLSTASTASTTRSVFTTLADAIRRGPVQVAGLLVTVALLTNLVVGLAAGRLDQTGIGLRLIVLGFALVASRVEMTLDELRDSRAGQIVRTLLAPPELEESERERERER